MKVLSDEELNARLQAAEDAGRMKGHKDALDLLMSYGCEFVNVKIVVADLARRST